MLSFMQRRDSTTIFRQWNVLPSPKKVLPRQQSCPRHHRHSVRPVHPSRHWLPAGTARMVLHQFLKLKRQRWCSERWQRRQDGEKKENARRGVRKRRKEKTGKRGRRRRVGQNEEGEREAERCEQREALRKVMLQEIIDQHGEKEKDMERGARHRPRRISSNSKRLCRKKCKRTKKGNRKRVGWRWTRRKRSRRNSRRVSCCSSRYRSCSSRCRAARTATSGSVR
mmetsp:Transcript_68452/g.111103  ORF Transcript_68452/g.111103 Transcript_68452/m.111103 type:complete len:225 (+) Transcript_68452:1041-1715(+)